MDRPNLVVFDFDATLTWCDSFIPFLRFHAGRAGFWRRMAGLAPDLVAWRRGRLSREAMKEKTCRAFLAGLSEEALQESALRYSLHHDRRLLNIQARRKLRQHVDAGDRVVIVTASPEAVVRPFAETFDVAVIGTRLAVEDGVLSGNLASPNCRGPEKITRLIEQFGPDGGRLKAAYGDSAGDNEILAAADAPHYRDFRGPLFRLRAAWVFIRLMA